MAKIIRIDRKLGRLGRKLVRDTGGAPCCCGGGCPLWRKLANCEFGFLRRWICDTSTCADGSPVTPGKIIRADGDCWTVTDTTDPDPPDFERLTETVFECFPDCVSCNPPPATLCCDSSNGTYGLTKPTWPHVRFTCTPTVSEFKFPYDCGSGDSCGIRYWETWIAPWTTRSADEESPSSCINGCSDGNAVDHGNVGDLCGNNGNLDNHFYTNIGYEPNYVLIAGLGRSPPVPIGFHDQGRACIGTSDRPPGPYLGGSVFASAGTDYDFHGSHTVRWEYAISLIQPDKWWLFADGTPYSDPDFGPGDSAITGQVTLSGSGPFTVSFTSRRTASGPWRCNGDPNQMRFVNSALTMSCAMRYDGIGPCSGFRPPDWGVRAATGEETLAVMSENAAAIEAALGANPMHRCRGCGG